jgi:hypothetical protein
MAKRARRTTKRKGRAVALSNAYIFVTPSDAVLRRRRGRGRRPKVLVVPDRAYARRGEDVTWHVLSVDRGTDRNDVCVKFNRNDNPLEDGPDPNYPSRYCARSGNISAHVRSDARRDTYKYSVLVDDEVIVDPELEIG